MINNLNSYQIYLEKYAEFGIVERLNYPVVFVTGLPMVSIGEVVMFENNSKGQVLSIVNDKIEILLFSKVMVRKGMKVARTGENLKVPVGKYLLGKVVDPLGKSLISVDGILKPEEYREIDVSPVSIKNRSLITEPLITGISLVDLLIPLGKGQREIIVGDRKTGKSSLIKSIIKSCISQGDIAIYAAIGKKSIEIEAFRNDFEKEGLLNSMVMVVSSALDSQTLIYFSPFTAMAIAEYFKDQGRSVLVVLDDLSTHAKYTREISLLAKRFPGRDSYPGNMFFTHARLLERAGSFIVPGVEDDVTITCLPVAETVNNDLTDYIVSNLIGITDGHILLDTEEFHKGRRPAINSETSVTRVGKQTRNSLHQDITQEVTHFFTKYQNSQSFSHFGAELTDEVKLVLDRGSTLYKFFFQSTMEIIPEDLQLVFIAMIWLDFFDKEKPIENIKPLIIDKYEKDDNFRKFIEKIIQVVNFSDLIDSVKNHITQIEENISK